MDFSLANLTFDENCYCLHTLKPGAENDYVEVLTLLQEAMSSFSKFSLAYGFGARTIPGDGNSTDLISMTGDLLNPFLSMKHDNLLRAYSNTLRNVKLALPVNVKAIIKLVCDIAQIEYGTCSEI